MNPRTSLAPGSDVTSDLLSRFPTAVGQRVAEVQRILQFT